MEEQIEKRKAVYQPKCMNCGIDINIKENSLYGRRFCSTKCMEKYLAP